MAAAQPSRFVGFLETLLRRLLPLAEAGQPYEVAQAAEQVRGRVCAWVYFSEWARF